VAGELLVWWERYRYSVHTNSLDVGSVSVRTAVPSGRVSAGTLHDVTWAAQVIVISRLFDNMYRPVERRLLIRNSHSVVASVTLFANRVPPTPSVAQAYLSKTGCC
jgi:hypothetical protein